MLTDAKDLSTSSYDLMRNVYSKWAPVYDLIYNQLTFSPTQAAVSKAVRCGNTILEAGVGTGLAFKHYPGTVNLYGIDLSEHMLCRAYRKTVEENLNHVHGLQIMNVESLGYKDNNFDAVVAQYLITLVPDPEKVLSEFLRVVKPGGEIILVNHFGQESGLLARFEAKIAPLCKKLGLSSDFKIQRVQEWSAQNNVTFYGVEGAFLCGFYKLIRLKKAIA